MTTKYLWAGELLISQDDGTNQINWSYDHSGTAVGFAINGTPYFYLRNLQNDVVGIYDLDGSVVVRYTYDAWGNILTTTGPAAATLGALNPIRYRGYYYDTETGYYYCQSRYYNPLWCRWISADVLMDTGDGVLGTNMYAYCNGDPVNFSDPEGEAPTASELNMLKKAAAKVGAGKDFDWKARIIYQVKEVFPGVREYRVIQQKLGGSTLVFYSGKKADMKKWADECDKKAKNWDILNQAEAVISVALSIAGFVKVAGLASVAARVGGILTAAKASPYVFALFAVTKGMSMILEGMSKTIIDRTYYEGDYVTFLHSKHVVGMRSVTYYDYEGNYVRTFSG